MIPRNLFIWVTIVVFCLVLGASFIIDGAVLVGAGRPSGEIFLPIGIVVFVFGIAMIFIVRRTRRSSGP